MMLVSRLLFGLRRAGRNEGGKGATEMAKRVKRWYEVKRKEKYEGQTGEQKMLPRGPVAW